MAASVPHQAPVVPEPAVYGRLRTALGEKTLQQHRRFLGKNPRNDVNGVVQTRIRDDVVERKRGPRSRILGAVDQTFDPGKNQRAGTHGTRLKGYVHARIHKVTCAEFFGRSAECKDLCVGRGIRPQLSFIAGSSDDLFTYDDNAPYGDVVMLCCAFCLRERNAHVRLVDHVGDFERFSLSF